MSPAGKVLSAAAEHPVYAPENCINRRQRRFACTVCSAVCPSGVFSLKSGEALKWDRCLDCELCVAACPSRCFAPSPSVRRSYREDPDLKAPVVFACREEEEPGDLRVRCLAAVPWELLGMLAMHTEIVLYTGACAACEKKAWAGRVKEQLALLRDFLGEERWARRVHVLTEGRFEAPPPDAEEEAPEQLLSRQEVFAGLKRRMAKGLYRAAASRLPLLGDDSPDGMQFRRALAETAAAEQKRLAEVPGAKEAPPDYGVKLPQFTVNCYGCGICEKLCPQKAIEIGPEQGGKRLVCLTPWRCTGCSLCTHACPHKGIAGLHTVRVPRLTKLALVRVTSASCEGCGIAVPPGSDPPLCPSCAAKAARKKNR